MRIYIHIHILRFHTLRYCSYISYSEFNGHIHFLQHLEYPARLLKFKIYRASDRRKTPFEPTKRSKRKKMLGVIIRTCHFFIWQIHKRRRLRRSRHGKCSDKEMLDRSRKNTGTSGATIHTQTQLIRRKQIARRYNDEVPPTIRRRAPRVFSPSTDFQPSSLTPFMREKRVRARFRLTPANWQGTLVGKSDPAVKGENTTSRNNGATGARRGLNRRRNKNKRREAIRLKVWTGTR